MAPSRFLTMLAFLALSFLSVSFAQQYMGDVIPNSLPTVPGSEIAYFRVNSNTLINYYSHQANGQRLVESQVMRAMVIIHGLNQDPATYESNALSALAQVTSDPNVNFSSVAVMAPFFANGDDKGTGYPWTNGLSPGRGSTSNCLVWKSSQWSAGANNQYPYTSTNTSSYMVLDQIIQYFDNATLFPNMKQIVIAGHSLGGQTVQRYAAIGQPGTTRSPVTYWVANPNSYVWFSTSRPLSTAGCSIYDNYREGYTNFSAYPMTYGIPLVNSGRPNILANFNSKAIAYGRGTQDLGDDASTCAPETTGSNRNERFFNFIAAFPVSCPDPAGRNCDTVDFVDVGHDAGQMMAAPAGQARLFTDNFYGNGSRAYDFGYPRQQAGDDPYPNPALNGTAASINNNTYAGNMTYWGCWSDQSPQTLTNLTYTSGSNTIEMCTSTCAQGGNTIAGLEYGTQCFCGSSLGYQATEVIDSSCASACSGNSNETCGGLNRLSLFSNGRPYVQPMPGTPETVNGLFYIGCYTEATTGRALNAKSISGSFMSLEYCAGFCGAYQYFGTEYADECYCGNSFAAGSNLTTDSDCSMVCANNTAEFCGAGNRLTVYQNTTWVAPTTTGTAGGSTLTDVGSSGQGVSCPSSNNTVVTSGGKSFTIMCGIDYFGGDLTSTNVNSFQACIDACAQNSQCVDVSLSGSACYLKSTLGAGVANAAIWGAKLVTAGGTTATTTTGGTTATTNTGGQPTTFTTSTSQNTPSPSPSQVKCPDANSTTFTASNGAAFLIECSIDHAGGDMSSQPVNSFADCINACATTNGCVDVSLSGAVCYLKSTLGAPVQNGVWGAKLVTSSRTTSTSSTSASTSSSTATTSSISTSTSSTSASSTSTSSTSTPSTSSTSTTSTSTSSTSTSTSSSSMSSTSTSSTSTSSTSTTSTSTTSTSSTSTSTSSTSSTSTITTSSTSSTSTSSTSTSSSSTSSSSTSSTTTAASTALPSGFSSLGCFIDSTSSRALPNSNGTSAKQTPQQCALNCRANGYKYSGTEYASECWCGNTQPANSAPATDCNMKCSGDGTQFCGAGNRLSVVLDNTYKQTFFAAPNYNTWNLMGCYVDSTSSRVVKNSVSLAASGGASNATIGNCMDACAAKGYTYCGEEYYSECYGATTAPPSSAVASGADALSAGCNYPCKGNSSQACGGSNRILVYINNGTSV